MQFTRIEKRLVRFLPIEVSILYYFCKEQKELIRVSSAVIPGPVGIQQLPIIQLIRQHRKSRRRCLEHRHGPVSLVVRSDAEDPALRQQRIHLIILHKVEEGNIPKPEGPVSHLVKVRLVRSDLRADHAEPQLRIRRGQVQEHLGVLPALAARDPDGVIVLFARFPDFTEVQALLEDGHPRVGPLSEDIVTLQLVLRHDEVRKACKKKKERALFVVLLVFPLALDVVRQHEDEAHAENARIQREKARLDREPPLKDDVRLQPAQGAVVGEDLFKNGIAFLERGNQVKPVGVVEIDDRVIGDE